MTNKKHHSLERRSENNMENTNLPLLNAKCFLCDDKYAVIEVKSLSTGAHSLLCVNCWLRARGEDYSLVSQDSEDD